ncbi:MAG: FAD-dependent oxidoreductase, partial [Anaerolineales bacterium]|nr:FAD-dependent oxidoreductase [Anaerolineales bacterium]
YTEIPYRCMVPQEIENLIVAGRSVSAEWDAMGVLRIMPACFAMGQAAGTAAAMAARTGRSFSALDIEELKHILTSQGAIFSPR